MLYILGTLININDTLQISKESGDIGDIFLKFTIIM